MILREATDGTKYKRKYVLLTHIIMIRVDTQGDQFTFNWMPIRKTKMSR